MALNLADLFEHAADAFGDRVAVACGDREVTYRQLDERSTRLAHHLASIGVGPGDDETVARHFAKRIATLRIFADDAGKMNLDFLAADAQILAISQFTLFAMWFDMESNKDLR